MAKFMLGPTMHTSYHGQLRRWTQHGNNSTVAAMHIDTKKNHLRCS